MSLLTRLWSTSCNFFGLLESRNWKCWSLVVTFLKSCSCAGYIEPVEHTDWKSQHSEDFFFFLHNSTLTKYPISSEPPNSSYVPTFEWPCNYRKLCFLNETVRLFRPTTWAFRVNKCVYGVCRLFGCCLSQPEEQLTVSLKSAETRSHNTAWSQGQTRWAHIAHSWV